MGNTARTGQGERPGDGASPWPGAPVARHELARLHATVETLAHQLRLILTAAGQHDAGPDNLFTATATAQARRHCMRAIKGGRDGR